MPITSTVNSKANVKQQTSQDLPFSQAYPVLADYAATSTAAQTVVNLPFTIQATGTSANTGVFDLFVDGKKLQLGSSNDYTFTSIGSDGTSSQVTLNQALAANLNIYARKLGLKREVEFITDNRFTQAYEYLNDGFQGFVNQNEFLLTPTATTGTPAAGTFYSAIVGRASMTDLSQSLKAQMGIERMETQGIFLSQAEFGSNGEPVWLAMNDTFGQIRFVGYGWAAFGAASGSGIGIAPNTNGLGVYTSTANDYVEVTFYGTGLNCLLFHNSQTNSYAFAVDGVSTGTYSMTTSFSGILTSRNYTQNIPITVASGLSLGIHTVKISYTSGTLMGISGFEVLNESSLVKVASGVGYIQGKKYVSSALQSFAYNSVATGSRGGRVVVYQNGDGTIGQSWQAVNASQGNLTSADHTNEEIVRTYHWREFGAGRTDDFSRIGTGTSGPYAFTLDDGVTTLTADSIFVLAGTDGFNHNSTNNFNVFTFVGTGLDIINSRGSAVTEAYDIFVDGTAIATNTTTAFGNGLNNQVKIVSGLPYGTHTVKFVRKNNIANGLFVNKFIVYQPKKPSIPSGAVELADYNVMATFVRDTSPGVLTASTGVMRKMPIREMVLVDGTGANAIWALSSLDATNLEGGFRPASSRVNAYWQYTFFGSGFEYRGTSSSGESTSVLVSLNGVTLSTANFTINGTGSGPAVTVNTAGNWTFTASTGVLNQNNASVARSNLSISGLSIGTYTIKFLNQNDGGNVQVESFDIITPIHSVKSNIYADLQNTLPVGSCGISDNRKTTPVKEALPSQKAWAQAVGVTSGPTTTSTTLVPMPDMSVTVKTGASVLDISYSVSMQLSTSANTGFTAIFVDGIQVGAEKPSTADTANFQKITAERLLVPVSSGTHKIDIYWRQNGAVTLQSFNLARNLTVREL